MKFRPRTVRRLAVLLAVMAVIAAVAASLLAWQSGRRARELTAMRSAGMAAVASGDMPAALQTLLAYVPRAPNDAEARLALVKARMAVDMPRGRRMTEAAADLNRYLELRPDDNDAWRMLLEIYPLVGRFADARDIADRLLATDPNDLAALRGKTVAEASMHRYDEALQTSERFNVLAPDDIEGHKMTFGLLYAARKPLDVLVQRSQRLLDEHRDDPRFEYLHGLALTTAGDPTAADWLRKAASHPAPDENFVRLLAKALDDIGLFADTQLYLERSLAASPDPNLLLILAERLWQQGRPDDALARIGGLDPATGDPDLLGLQALILFQSAEAGSSPLAAGAIPKMTPAEATAATARATSIVEALSKRESGAAEMWSRGLRAKYVSPPASSQALAEALRDTQAYSEPNGPLLYMLGQAYADMGETAAAVDAWKAAARAMPAWAAPYQAIAWSLLGSDRHVAALDSIKEAMRRAPSRTDIAIDAALVWSAKLAITAGPGESEQLLELIERIRDGAGPGGEPRTVAAYAALLARLGRRDDAAGAITRAMEYPQDFLASDWLAIATVDRDYRLGLSDPIQRTLAKIEPADPESAMAIARSLHTVGRTQDGLGLLTNAASAQTDPRWPLAVARFRELIGDPNASSAWIELGNAFPQNLSVQSAILQSETRFSNRAFWLQTIERVRSMTGEKASLWRIEQARYVLSDATLRHLDRDMAAVLVALKDLIRTNAESPDPRVLLATAYESAPQPNLTAAIEQLKVAASLRPSDLAIGLRLYNLLRSQGEFEEARSRLNRLADSALLTAVSRTQIATLLADQGELERAVQLLERSGAEDRPPETEVLLAGLLQRVGRIDEAAKAYAGLESETDLPVAAVLQAAGFYASKGDRASADRWLARLSSMQLPAGQLMVLLAGFEETYGKPTRADELYTAAVAAAPASPDVLRRRAAFLLRQGRPEDAQTAARNGLAYAPDDPGLTTLAACARLLTDQPDFGDLQPLLQVLWKNPEAPGTYESLIALNDAHIQQLPPHATAARLRKVADLYPQSLPAQALAVQGYLAAGHTAQGAALAERAVRTFPGDPDARRLRLESCSPLTDPVAAVEVARQYRELTLDNPADADAAVSWALLSLGDLPAARQHLEAHEKAINRSDPNPHLLRSYIAGLLAAGRHDLADDLMTPLIALSPAWRKIGLEVAWADRDPGAAGTWVNTIATRVPADSIAERHSLAAAWHEIGARHRHAASLETAAREYERLARDKPDSALIWKGLGDVRRDLGDLPAAEAAYRNAAKIESDFPDLADRMSQVILLQDGDLDEAMSLAISAVNSVPESVTFLTTLGRLQAARGNDQAAIKTFESALHQRPAYAPAMIGLAAALYSADRVDEARSVAAHARTELRRTAKPDPALDEQLRALLERLGS